MDKLVLLSLAGMIFSSAITPVLSQELNTKSEKSTFFCDETNTPPVIYMNLDGLDEPKEFLTWHPEYLLPQQQDASIQLCQKVTQKLENSLLTEEKIFLTTQVVGKTREICLVTNLEKQCKDNDAQTLVYLDGEAYSEISKCFIRNTTPEKCISVRKRGNLLINPYPSEYKPRWWPF